MEERGTPARRSTKHEGRGTKDERTDFLGDGPRMMPGSVDVPFRFSGSSELIISRRKEVGGASPLAVRAEKDRRAASSEECDKSE